MLGVVRTLYTRYLLATNTITCGGLLGLGDGIQQQIERSNETGKDKENWRYDWARTGRMFAVGLALGPLTHWWYGVLDRIYPKPVFRNVARKILLDQIFGAPTFSLVFIVGMAKLEGRTNVDSLQEFANKFPFIYLVDWFVWPPCQTLNFYLVPPKFRALFVYNIDLCWYTFNSWVKHKREELPMPMFLRDILSHYESPRPHHDHPDHHLDYHDSFPTLFD